MKFGPKHTRDAQRRAEDWIGKDEIIVNSLHWQGIKTLAKPLVAEAFARGWSDRGHPRAGRQSILARRAMASRVATAHKSRIRRALPPLRRSRKRHDCKRPSRMTDTFITIDETEAFLRANPDVTWIDLILFDMNGIPRGKRFRRDDLMGLAKNGLLMPETVFILDPRGNCVEETGRLWETGDPDIPFRILEGTLRPVPTGTGRYAQAVMSVVEHNDLDPRGVLARQVSALATAGQTPVVAVELEFYVAKQQKNGVFRLEMPEGLSEDPESPMIFGFEDMDALAPFIDDIYKIAETQGLPIDAVMQEFGTGAVRDQPEAQGRSRRRRTRWLAAEARGKGSRHGARA